LYKIERVQIFPARDAVAVLRLLLLLRASSKRLHEALCRRKGRRRGGCWNDHRRSANTHDRLDRGGSKQRSSRKRKRSSPSSSSGRRRSNNSSNNNNSSRRKPDEPACHCVYNSLKSESASRN